MSIINSKRLWQQCLPGSVFDIKEGQCFSRKKKGYSSSLTVWSRTCLQKCKSRLLFLLFVLLLPLLTLLLLLLLLLLLKVVQILQLLLLLALMTKAFLLLMLLIQVPCWLREKLLKFQQGRYKKDDFQLECED
jgi:cellulose synthase/poly-beta-1,6-N-acetylglucosamine synthase-like glycosyltransferase